MSFTNATLEDNSTSSKDGRPSIHPQMEQIVFPYLSVRSETFRGLEKLRSEGWKSTKGDNHFKQQRKQADEADERTKHFFFESMQKIGIQLQAATGVLVLPCENPQVLDLCMAPGGYTASALRYNPHASVSAISLPTALGGHEVLVSKQYLEHRIDLRYLDITMLAAEFSIEEIPIDHPDAADFLTERPFHGTSFDLVFCDGQVLRTHAAHRSDYREKNEATRLTCSQLILAMQRVKTGGTLVMLLHKVEAWDTMELLRTLDKIANIQLFKPTKSHATRGSFYLVAKNIQPNKAEAKSAVKGWKERWKAVTFPVARIEDSEDALASTHSDEQSKELSGLLEDFGERLIELGEPVWQIQKDALGRAPWLQKKREMVAIC